MIISSGRVDYIHTIFYRAWHKEMAQMGCAVEVFPEADL